MKNSIGILGAICGAGVIAAATWATPSAADTVVVQPVTQVPPPTYVEKTTSSPPNRALIGGGLIAFGGAYVPSVIVAIANNNSYDNNLYIPVVGPWIDLGNRPACGGFGQTSCGTEDGFKALLIIDGAVQGLGALATVLGLAVPETHTTIVQAAKGPTVHVTPAPMSKDGYGVVALGDF